VGKKIITEEGKKRVPCFKPCNNIILKLEGSQKGQSLGRKHIQKKREAYK